MGSPEVAVAIFHAQRMDHVLDHEALPGRTDLGVPVECLRSCNLQKAMEDSGIPDVDLWRLDLAFLEVRAPRLQAPHHERRFQGLAIPPYRVVRHAECTGEFRAVPHLSVVVREHGPEPVKRNARNGDPELRDIAFQERTNEVGAPLVTLAVASSRERTREPTPKPKTIRLVRIDLFQGDSREFVMGHAAGQGLGALTEERRRCTA